jgi:hypothetical protein
MKSIKLDSILVFTLIIPFIMGFRISPFTTQYWYFGIVFLAMLIYLALDLLSIKERLYHTLKNSLLWLLLALIIGGAFAAAIDMRHKTHPIYKIHDIILQQEAAIRYLLDGKNPYAETYHGTFMEQWNYSETEENPALYHFVMEPLYLVFPLPFYFLSNRLFGFFDARIPLVFLFTLLLLAAFLLIKDQDKKRMFVALLGFHPAMLPYTLEGRSDIFMYSFLFISFALLYKTRYVLSAIFAAFAFAVKQSVWPLFPFYVLYVYFKTKSITKTIVTLIFFFVPFLTIVLPFYFWNQSAFIASTISFLTGTTEHSYPIAGYGLGGTLVELKIIADKFAYYPFTIWQVSIGLPVFIGLVLYLKKNPSVKKLITVYGIFLFVYWYFSRYFHNSHLAYISILFISAYFWPEAEQNRIQEQKQPAAIQSVSQGRRFKRE